MMDLQEACPKVVQTTLAQPPLVAQLHHRSFHRGGGGYLHVRCTLLLQRVHLERPDPPLRKKCM